MSDFHLSLPGDFSLYLSSLKSRRRRRLRRAMKKGERLRVFPLRREDFSAEHYRLYEEVYRRSEGKLEKLEPVYFRESPGELFSFEGEEGLLAFVQILEKKGELLFLFCGLHQPYNRKYDLYLNMLLFMIRTACHRGLSRLRLGQTTSHSKRLTGAREKEQYFYLTSRFLLLSLLKRMVRLLSSTEGAGKEAGTIL